MPRMNLASVLSAAVGALTALSPMAAHAARCPGQAPVLVVAQDWSGSMVGTIDGSLDETQPKKHTTTRTALPDVLSQYDADFQYALMMYPSAGGCSFPMTPQLGVDSTSDDIAMSLAVNPSGRTPTADTLTRAKAYIDSLNLPANVPAHVVLVTDGLPNCNPNLDPATCLCDDLRTGAGASGGAPSFCYANNDPNRCLDADRPVAAAAALAAAGHRVYVVGFGSFVNQGNNAQVLNSIAAAGGTSQSYNATDPAGFSTALNTVVAAARDCCLDGCTAGSSSCTPSGNSATQCVLGAQGCYEWQTTACNAGAICTGGACQACVNNCTAGARRCGLLGRELCVADANGCTDWEFDGLCPNGTTCQGGSCSACNTTCTEGQQQCQGDGSVRTCRADLLGCTSWGPATECTTGTVCNAATNSCQSCTSTCVAGARQCTDSAMSRVCVADARGCTSWAPEACDPGETCNGGTCAACNACAAGQTRCAGAVVQTCVADGQGCTAWADTNECQGGQLCQAGACTSCPTSCTPGTTECASDNVRTCVTAANGCNDWQVVTMCQEPQTCVNGACCTNQCNEGSVRCAADGASTEVCGRSATGCTAWQPQTRCPNGAACTEGQCLQTCIFSPEGDDCPLGYECTPGVSGSFCVPISGGNTSSSGGASGSTSSGGASSGNASGGLGGGTTSGGGGRGPGGAGEEEEDTTTTGCGCAVDRGNPEGFLFFGLLALALRRRRI